MYWDFILKTDFIKIFYKNKTIVIVFPVNDKIDKCFKIGSKKLKFFRFFINLWYVNVLLSAKISGKKNVLIVFEKVFDN